MMTLETRLVSSLEKIFPDESLDALSLNSITALRGEMVSFQIALKCETELSQWARVTVQSPWPGVHLRRVEVVPCRFVSAGFDDNYLRKVPGLFPDALLPLEEGERFLLRPGQWQSLWVSLPVAADAAAGSGVVSFEIQLEDAPARARAEISIEILEAALPAQALIRSEWFHADCIWTQYGVPCWSEAHWELLARYFSNATAHGINMLLTPLWTLPLDTKVGGERPTTQLLEIRKDGAAYTFDFQRLERWLRLGLECGFTHFDFAHVFTQWGAKATPKIVVLENGVEKNLFGWHVSSNDPEYANFLRQLLPPLLAVVKKFDLEERVFFHVSDEPTLEHLETYRAGAALLRSLIGDIPILDALSSADFYDTGVVDIPASASDHIEPFLERKIPKLFTYHCVAQWNKVPNRFLAMPSARNRVMGVLLYVHDLTGFLHWGYNFWYTQYSLKRDIDPFFVTDAGGCFAGGDPFAVYPGPDGPVDSIRHEVFTEALQDLRALRLLEEKIGRAEVLALVHGGLDAPLTMTAYPKDAGWLLALRQRVNEHLR